MHIRLMFNSHRMMTIGVVTIGLYNVYLIAKCFTNDNASDNV